MKKIAEKSLFSATNYTNPHKKISVINVICVLFDLGLNGYFVMPKQTTRIGVKKDLVLLSSNSKFEAAGDYCGALGCVSDIEQLYNNGSED